MVPNLQFMAIIRQYGLYMTLDDQKDFLDYMSLGAQKNNYNLQNVSKILEILSKVSYSQQKEELRKESLNQKKDEFVAVSDEHFERFCENLRKKLNMVFLSSAELL